MDRNRGKAFHGKTAHVSSLTFVQTTAHAVVTRFRNDSYMQGNVGGNLDGGEPVFVLETSVYMTKVLCRLGVRWLMNSWVGIT